jgi:hypothetical protein
MVGAPLTLVKLMVQLTATLLMDMLTTSISVVLAHAVKPLVMECSVSRRLLTSDVTMTMATETLDSDHNSMVMTILAVVKLVQNTHSLLFRTTAGVRVTIVTVTQ